MSEEVALKIAQWMTGPGVGISSKAIGAATIGALPADPHCYPHDSDDFSRCRRLIALIPEARAGLTKLAGWSAQWARLDAAWDEMTTLFDAGDHRAVSALIDKATNPNDLRSYRIRKGDDGRWDIFPSDSSGVGSVRLGDNVTVRFGD